MKTLVLYSSKYGTTKSCAEKISKSLGCDINSLDQDTSITLDDYSHIILGTSVYMGKLRKPLTDFVEKNDDLQDKDLSIFFCCNEETDYQSLVPSQLKKVKTYHFGYELKLSKMKFMDKFITKMIVKASQDVSRLNASEIEKLIDTFKEVPN
ncbi:flavodoxin domain-containing protein [Acidaminobacter sp. JC074]|uniref:flavodoxin domain-containing protein n=1 Tax=Acidaminobacter sp. JC074 TaxID=2530199 RepID=UPI001F0E90DB|nr:flavodoxin domain-containing protein [Acidaminobacter sp. JC074]